MRESEDHRGRSPMAFVALALLAEEPMHAYRMQQLIRKRGKDKVVNVSQRNSVQQALGRLLRDGLIAIAEQVSDGAHPQRTVYRITDRGSAALHTWLDQMLSDPAREYPQFPAALAFLGLTGARNVADQLTARRETLAAEVEQLELSLAAPHGLPRVFVVEDEYLLAMRRAELGWVDATLDDLAAGRLGWNTRDLLRDKWRYDDD